MGPIQAKWLSCQITLPIGAPPRQRSVRQRRRNCSRSRGRASAALHWGRSRDRSQGLARVIHGRRHTAIANGHDGGDKFQRARGAKCVTDNGFRGRNGVSPHWAPQSLRWGLPFRHVCPISSPSVRVDIIDHIREIGLTRPMLQLRPAPFHLGLGAVRSFELALIAQIRVSHLGGATPRLGCARDPGPQRLPRQLPRRSTFPFDPSRKAGRPSGDMIRMVSQPLPWR